MYLRIVAAVGLCIIGYLIELSHQTAMSAEAKGGDKHQGEGGEEDEVAGAAIVGATPGWPHPSQEHIFSTPKRT